MPASKFRKNVYRPLRDSFLYYLTLTSLYVLPLFPRIFVLSCISALSHVVYRINAKLRNHIINNLSIAFGDEKSYEEKYVMGRNLIEQLSKTITDYILFWRLKTRKEFLKYFTVEGEEYLSNAYKKGHGIICLVPHTVGWEFSAIMPPVLGYTTFAVSQKLHNAALNRLIIKLRESRGMMNITRDHCFGNLVEGLQKGKCLIIMIDQDSMKIRGEFLDFFEKKAYTPLGSSRLACETNASIIPMYTVREKDNKYRFCILPEIPFEKKEDMNETLKYNTQIHNDVLESIVRKYPEQWLWFHDRWKTTPERLASYLQKREKTKNKTSY